MDLHTAIEFAGGGTKGRAKLAKLLGVTANVTYRWAQKIPEYRLLKLQQLRPHWFRKNATPKEKND